jgi:hypothetical protein
MDPQDCEWYLDNRDWVAQCHQQGLQKVDREELFPRIKALKFDFGILYSKNE